MATSSRCRPCRSVNGLARARIDVHRQSDGIGVACCEFDPAVADVGFHAFKVFVVHPDRRHQLQGVQKPCGWRTAIGVSGSIALRFYRCVAGAAGNRARLASVERRAPGRPSPHSPDVALPRAGTVRPPAPRSLSEVEFPARVHSARHRAPADRIRDIPRTGWLAYPKAPAR
jgi:hypothetical protein